jgi:hypothetical protein
MSVVGLEMHHYGQDLGAISVALGVHIVGMFGLSPILGAAVDRFGRARSRRRPRVRHRRRRPGPRPDADDRAALVFLVGVGWNLAYLAGTARVADATEPESAPPLGALDMAGPLHLGVDGDPRPGAPERREYRAADAAGGGRGRPARGRARPRPAQ